MAGDILLEAAADRRETEAEDFHLQMNAYVAETNSLLAAGRPLSERKLAPPALNPYEATFTDHAGQSLQTFGGFLGKVGIVALFGLILVGALFFSVIL